MQTFNKMNFCHSMSAGGSSDVSLYFQGTTAEQDNRFADKKKKLMKSMKFAEGIDRKVRF